MSFPDGHLIKDLIIYPLFASKGFELVLPDLREAGPAALNAYAETWQNILLQVPENFRLSFQGNRSADYSRELARYATETDRAGAGAWSRRVRQERHSRYVEAMKAKKLVRQSTVLFLSMPVPALPGLVSSPFHLEQRIEAAVQGASQSFDQMAAQLSRALAPHGGHLTAFTNADHHEYLARYLNPSLVDRPEFDLLTTFDPSQSIHENCWWSQATGGRDGFVMDGNFHAIRVIRRLPAQSSPDTLQPLWNLPGLNHRVTVNLRPLGIRHLIAREEREIRRIQSQHLTERKPSLLPTIEKKLKRVEALASQLLRPFGAEIILHTWAPTQEALAAQCAAAEQAIQAAGAQYFSPTHPSTSKRLFAQTWPGHPWGSYRHYELYAESTYLPDLLPLASSFTGYIDSAEAIYETAHGSLVGLRTTSGGQPLHMIISGMSGSGKSMLLGDLISQIALYFGSFVFIDYGGSHQFTARALDPHCESLVLHPNSAATLNYLDTQGLPLSNEFLADASTIVSLMSGSPGSEREDRLRRVAVSDAIKDLCAARFDQLERTDPERALNIARRALAMRRRSDATMDSIEGFIDFRDWQETSSAEAAGLLAGISDGEAVAFLKNPATRPGAIRLACADWLPHEQLTHSEVREWLHLRAAASRDPLVGDLARIMEDFSRGGAGGNLFDGMSTLDRNQRVLHLELGRLDDRNPALLAAAGHLAHSFVMRRNLVLPKRMRKFVLFEEASAFLSLPGSEALMRRGFEQARKVNVVMAAVFQNYSRLRALEICNGLLGNAQQFLFLKQDGLPDLKHLGEDLGLPQRTLNLMSQFRRPADAGHADFALFSRDVPHPVCGVARHVPSKEMFYLTQTTPAGMDARAAALGRAGEILTRIEHASF